MTDKPTDEIERRASEEAKKFNWSGVVNRLRTGNYAFKLGFLAGHSAAKEEVEGLRLKVDVYETSANYYLREFESACERLRYRDEELDALKKENAELIFGAAEKINALKTAQGELISGIERLHDATDIEYIKVHIRGLLERLRKGSADE